MFRYVYCIQYVAYFFFWQLCSLRPSWTLPFPLLPLIRAVLTYTATAAYTERIYIRPHANLVAAGGGEENTEKFFLSQQRKKCESEVCARASAFCRGDERWKVFVFTLGGGGKRREKLVSTLSRKN